MIYNYILVFYHLGTFIHYNNYRGIPILLSSFFFKKKFQIRFFPLTVRGNDSAKFSLQKKIILKFPPKSLNLKP